MPRGGEGEGGRVEVAMVGEFEGQGGTSGVEVDAAGLQRLEKPALRLPQMEQQRNWPDVWGFRSSRGCR